MGLETGKNWGNSMANEVSVVQPSGAEAVLMQTYQITFDGKKYNYFEYSYDKLQDAINYAKRQPRREEQNLTTKSVLPLGGKRAIVLGGSGWSAHANNAYMLSLSDDALGLRALDRGTNIEISFSDLTAVEIAGPGTISTNAGLAGGGFGLEGAALGIAAATLVNAVTSRKTTNTFLRLATLNAEIFLHLQEIEPAALRFYLSPAIITMDAKRFNMTGCRNSLSSELNELASLVTRGFLTQDEFQLAKNRLLAS